MHLRDRISIELGYSGRRWSSGWLLLSCMSSGWLLLAMACSRVFLGGWCTISCRICGRRSVDCDYAVNLGSCARLCHRSWRPGSSQAARAGGPGRAFLMSRFRAGTPVGSVAAGGALSLAAAGGSRLLGARAPHGRPFSARCARRLGPLSLLPSLPTVSYKTWDVTYNGVQRTISQYRMLTHDIKECTVSLKEVHMTQFG